MPSLFGNLPPDSQNILENFDSILQNVQFLNSKQQHSLPLDIRQLSHLLTDDRPSRRLGYMNETRFLSAYTRYFMWWNLVRLTSVFSGIEAPSFENLVDNSFALDVGSGPLTVPISLWLSHPELRSKKITWYCMDLSSSILSLGEEIFLSVVSRTNAIASSTDQSDLSSATCEPWRIIRIKGPLGTELHNAPVFISCANVFNEMYWNSSKPLEYLSKNYSLSLLKYLKIPKDTLQKTNATVFIAEPGVPRAARFVTLTRNFFLRNNWSVVSPCPHFSDCPMDGRKGGKWCHFVLDATKAPKKLQALSESAGLPKDRASISFVFMKSKKELDATKTKTLQLRVISDQIFLPNKSVGRYSCSKLGLTLLIEKYKTNNPSGTLLTMPLPNLNTIQIDKKSGSKIIVQNNGDNIGTTK